MEIKVTITAEPALMALLENLGKTILIAGTDLREAAETMPAAAPTATTTPAQSIPAVSVTVPTPMPTTNPVTPAPAAVVPTAPAHTYTLSELGVAGADLAQNGKRDQLIALLQSFGVQALTQLSPERYPEFAQGLRALGAKI